jgi:hypothetical protein
MVRPLVVLPAPRQREVPGSSIAALTTAWAVCSAPVTRRSLTASRTARVSRAAPAWPPLITDYSCRPPGRVSSRRERYSREAANDVRAERRSEIPRARPRDNGIGANTTEASFLARFTVSAPPGRGDGRTDRTGAAAQRPVQHGDPEVIRQ